MKKILLKIFLKLKESQYIVINQAYRNIRFLNYKILLPKNMGKQTICISLPAWFVGSLRKFLKFLYKRGLNCPEIGIDYCLWKSKTYNWYVYF